MAEIAASFIGPAIEVVKWIGAPIIRQFNYLCCFTSNIATLKHEAQALDDATKGLQGRVDGERNNVQVIVPEVDTWLTASTEIMDEMNGILNDAINVESGFLKLRDRFFLSKRANKTSDRIKELRDQCKFNVIAHPRPPAAAKSVLLGTAFDFQSRKQIQEDIMTSLRGGGVNMIGICGMGGLGKTTMAKMIMNRALKEHVFEEVVMAVVSQPVDKSKIQEDIGGPLGLKNLKDEASMDDRVKTLHARLTKGTKTRILLVLDDKWKIQVEVGGPLGLKNLKEEASMANRVQTLHARLTEGTKRILLVLDDIWERLVLEELGIPRDSKGCTILLTSRNHHVLSAMDVKVFGMEVLSEEDAWLLFKARAGTCVDDTRLNSMAKEVVEECKGLPIALTTVGAALKDETNKGIWKDAVRQLRKANPTNIPDFIKEVYNPLKVSYDKLDTEESKSVFLLCCLFGEDENIPLEKLTYFCMGLGVFEGGIEEGRDWMRTLTKMLKSRSLLLDGRNEDHVRMHDVVRDVCIFIAKHEGYIGHNDCTCLSSSFLQGGRITKLPLNLRLLFLTLNSKLLEEIKFDKSFVEGIKDLHVLCIEFYSFTSLPPATPSLKNLNSLMLYSCQELETLSVVGELANLEILICRYCRSIKELPQEMKGLDRLKLLDLTGCKNLERIAPGIISSLVGLEEMKMSESFKKWEASDSTKRENVNGNAKLRELESLINLRCLEIEIENVALVAEKMRFSSNLERFRIIIPLSYSLPSEFYSYPGDKKMSLEWEGGSCVGDWIGMQLIRDTESLHLTGNGANNVDLAKSENIKWLNLGKCKTMKNIGRTSLMRNDGRYGGAIVFPRMEFLKLFSLPELEEILDGPISSDSFQNLKELSLDKLSALKQFWRSSSGPLFSNLSSIEIKDCDSLRNLAQLSIAGKDCLSQLQTLTIKYCEMMEQVFLWNEEEDQNINNRESTITKMFPKLNKVDLNGLPNLTTFCQGIKGIEFPLLTEMHSSGCPKMTSMVSSNENNSGGSMNADIDEGHSLHLFCQVSFGNLKELRTCRNPFSCGHIIDASLFIGLEKLDIFGCEGIMSLFSPSIATNLFSLKELSVSFCNEMVKVILDEEEKAVSCGQTTLLFPKLQELLLIGLPKLVSICEWKCDVELPSLRRVSIFHCPNMKYLTLGFLGAPNLEALEIELNNYLEVSFPNMKQLTIRWNENPLYRYKNIHVSLFKRLEVLSIVGYKGSKSLFTSSTAENLVSLRELSIRSCDEMVKVIEDEEEEEEEEVVISAATQMTTLLSPKLQKLELDNLRKLVSFCEWGFHVEFPSLREVDISECPNIKYFTLGLLTTPKLEVVRINYWKDFGGLKDLNGAVQQQFEKKQQGEKKGGAEEKIHFKLYPQNLRQLKFKIGVAL